MKLDNLFEEHLTAYEAATVELVNTAPAGSEVAMQAINNLRECLQLRVNVEQERSGMRTSKGRRINDYYPDVDIERHFGGFERRHATVPRRAEVL